MGIPVMILGKSGRGKSASLRNFPEAGVINILGKPFPFRGAVKQVTTRSYAAVKGILNNGAAKTRSYVIDDAGYLITDYFMRNHSSVGGGNAVFSLYNDLADDFYSLVRFVSEEMPADKIVYFLMHEDKTDAGDIKPKTIGKLLDEKVCLEGLFTIVLRCAVVDGKHVFITVSNGYDVQKAPMGLFDADMIDNDLGAVDKAIREYYGIGGKQNEEN